VASTAFFRGPACRVGPVLSSRGPYLPAQGTHQVLLDADFGSAFWSKAPVALHRGHLNQGLHAAQRGRNVGDAQVVDEARGGPEVAFHLKAHLSCSNSVCVCVYVCACAYAHTWMRATERTHVCMHTRAGAWSHKRLRVLEVPGLGSHYPGQPAQTGWKGKRAAPTTGPPTLQSHARPETHACL